MDTDTDLNILTYFRCIAHNRSRLGQSCKVTSCVGAGGRLGQEGMCAWIRWSTLQHSRNSHTLESNSTPIWKSQAWWGQRVQELPSGYHPGYFSEVRISLKSHANRRFSLKGGFTLKKKNPLSGIYLSMHLIRTNCQLYTWHWASSGRNIQLPAPPAPPDPLWPGSPPAILAKLLANVASDKHTLYAPLPSRNGLCFPFSLILSQSLYLA